MGTTVLLWTGLATLPLWCLGTALLLRRRFPVATRALKQAVGHCAEMDWEELVDKIGKGYGGGAHRIDGVDCVFGVAVLHPSETGLTHRTDDAVFQRRAVPGQKLRRVHLVGHCDCVSLDPFGRFRIGPAVFVDLVRSDDGEVSVEAPRSGDPAETPEDRRARGPKWTTHVGRYRTGLARPAASGNR